MAGTFLPNARGLRVERSTWLPVAAGRWRLSRSSKGARSMPRPGRSTNTGCGVSQSQPSGWRRAMLATATTSASMPCSSCPADCRATWQMCGSANSRSPWARRRAVLPSCGKTSTGLRRAQPERNLMCRLPSPCKWTRWKRSASPAIPRSR